MKFMTFVKQISPQSRKQNYAWLATTYFYISVQCVSKYGTPNETERDYALFVLLFHKNIVLKNPTSMVFCYSTQKFLTTMCDDIL